MHLGKGDQTHTNIYFTNKATTTQCQALASSMILCTTTSLILPPPTQRLKLGTKIPFPLHLSAIFRVGRRRRRRRHLPAKVAHPAGGGKTTPMKKRDEKKKEILDVCVFQIQTNQTKKDRENRSFHLLRPENKRKTKMMTAGPTFITRQDDEPFSFFSGSHRSGPFAFNRPSPSPVSRSRNSAPSFSCNTGAQLVPVRSFSYIFREEKKKEPRTIQLLLAEFTLFSLLELGECVCSSIH